MHSYANIIPPSSSNAGKRAIWPRIAAILGLILTVFIGTSTCVEAPPKIPVVLSPVQQQNSIPVPLQSLNLVAEFADDIAGKLHKEQFAELDELAAGYRKTKERYDGGIWRLFTFYYGVRSPWPGRHATEEDWQSHIHLLEKWVAQRPSSITARVALAQAYLDYAWVARGDGYSDSVSESGWRIYRERAAKARRILEDAETLTEKCPQWFLDMQQVAQIEGWSMEEEDRLLERLIAFEPEYFYVYRAHSMYLLPKWNGAEGDAAAFANEIADRLGGDFGDIVYFDLANYLCWNSDHDSELPKMSWKRIESGFKASEKHYGPNAFRLNQLAYLAQKSGQPAVTMDAMTRLDGNWDEGIWKTKKFYDSVKDWADAILDLEAKQREMKSGADANLATPAGPKYLKSVERKLATALRDCTKESAKKVGFSFYLRLGPAGKVERMRIVGEAPAGECLMQAAYFTVFPKPPQEHYWVRVEVDPAKYQ